MTYSQDAVYLNLYNFDLPQHEDSPYIVTSPRSLKACHQLGIKPRELLSKSLDEYEEELHHLPLRDVIRLYEQGERLRQEKLSACRELRLRQVCGPLRRSAGRSAVWRGAGAGVRPDLLPPAATMSTATPRSALSRTKSVSWAGLDQSGDYFTDLPRDDGALSSEDEMPEDVWSSEDEDSDGSAQKQEDTGRALSSVRDEDERREDGDSAVEEAVEEGDADTEEHAEVGEGSDLMVKEEQDELSEEDVYEVSLDAAEENGSASEEEDEDTRHLRKSGPGATAAAGSGDEDEQEYGDARYLEAFPSGAAAAGGYSEPEDGGEEAEEGEEEEEPGWYPMEDYHPDLALELRSSTGFSAASAPPDGDRSRPAAVSFSDRPPEAARSPSRAARPARPASVAAHSRVSRYSTARAGEGRRPPHPAWTPAEASSAGWTAVPSLRTVSVGDLPSLKHLAASGADLQVRPSDRRILELMTRRQEQERLQERLAHQEHGRWRQEWLQQLRREAERADQQAELVLARRRAQASESSRRREELAQRHSQSLENLTALIRDREQRARLGLAEQQDRKHQQLVERQHREEQQRLLTSHHRQRLESEQCQQRQQQQQRLQRRMDETERRRCDVETARTQRVSSLNASWLALSEERLQRLDEAAARRSRHVWEQFSRRLQAAADNQRRQALSRHSHTAARSAADGERRLQARAARQRQLQLSAGRGREAAIQLQRDQLRAERAARQLAESRQLAVSRDNLARQTRHRHTIQHIRQLEGQMVDEARFKLKLDEARVEQFVKQRDMAVMSSRHLAHVAANLRQAVRSGERAAAFDQLAARADIECRVLNGPGQNCHRLYRPRSQTHIV